MCLRPIYARFSLSPSSSPLISQSLKNGNRRVLSIGGGFFMWTMKLLVGILMAAGTVFASAAANRAREVFCEWRIRRLGFHSDF